MALGFVPGVGQAMAVRDIERARRDDDPLGMALAGLSLVPFGKMIGAMRGGKQIGPVSQLDVYHGSPYKFDKFDASKIGTGEGAQAYGHGLYFAENQGVAKGYRNVLSDTLEVKGDALPLEKRVAQMALTFGDNTSDGALKWLSKFADKGANHTSPAMTPELIKSVGDKFKNGTFLQGGALYKVDLPDAQIAKMLDWDKPLSQQSKEVQKALRENELWNVVPEGRSLGEMVQAMNRSMGPERTSNILRDLGIPGIRYLDEGSRAGGKGTSNFVVFPGSESMLNILERNNQNVGNMMKPTVPAPSLMYKDPFGATY